MAEYTGNFETGVNGNTVSVLDPGSLTAWTDRQFSVDGTLQYSSTQKYGTLSCQSVYSATPVAAFVAWDSSVLGSSLANLWGRIYLYHSGLPNTLSGTIRGYESPTRAWEIRIDSSGFVNVCDTDGTIRGVGTVAISTGQWIRIEFHATNSTTAGFVEAKLFNSADSTTPTETITSSGSFSTLNKTDLLRIGDVFGLNASRTVYQDNILVNDTGYPGPVVVPSTDVLSMQAHIFGHGVW